MTSSHSSFGASIYSVTIINRFGSMMFSQDFTRNSKVSSNDSLRMASTFHGLHAISCELSPAPLQNSGILEIETDSFRMRCLQTATGLKFYCVAHPSVDSKALESLLAEIYALFCDFVLKNPFYEPDQPVRAAKFETALDKLIRH